MIEKLKKIIDHNQFLTIAAVAVLAIFSFVYGCQSEVTSIRNPQLKVNRQELQLEVQAIQTRLENELEQLQALAASKNQNLDKQDEIKAKIANIGLAVMDGGDINPVGLGVLALGLLGVGSAVDNRAKDKVIKVQKNGGK